MDQVNNADGSKGGSVNSDYAASIQYVRDCKRLRKYKRITVSYSINISITVLSRWRHTIRKIYFFSAHSLADIIAPLLVIASLN